MTDDTGSVDDMTEDEKRHDQLTTAPKASEEDAAPRIEVTKHDGVTRIDVAEAAVVRPGNPDKQGA
ncbi:MAG: multidrug transporter [Microbacteriaceae bacterium]